MHKIGVSKQNFSWVPKLILLTVKMGWVERLYTFASPRGATLEVRLLAEDICFSMYKKYLLSAMLQSESHATYFTFCARITFISDSGVSAVYLMPSLGFFTVFFIAESKLVTLLTIPAFLSSFFSSLPLVLSSVSSLPTVVSSALSVSLLQIFQF